MKGKLLKITKKTDKDGNEVKTKHGNPITSLTILRENGGEREYTCFEKEILEKKVGEEITYNEKEGQPYNGEIQWYLNLPKESKPFAVGGYRGKSPEELKAQTNAMVLSYAKDIVVALINNGKCEGLATTREYLDLIYPYLNSLLNSHSTGATKEPF